MSIKLDVHDDATEESTGYKVMGYTLEDEKIIRCPKCCKPLVSVIVVKRGQDFVLENGQLSAILRVRAKCLPCKMVSPNLVYERCKLFYQAVEGRAITDIDTSVLGTLTLNIK